MRNNTVRAEQYKIGERNYRMLASLVCSADVVTVTFNIQLDGFPLIPDCEPRQVKGPVAGVTRIAERPFARLKYLEYDEETRALQQATAKILDTTTNEYDPIHGHILSKMTQAFEDFESVKIQSSLGMIPTGIYCPEPVEIALDVFTIKSLAYEVY